MQGLYVNGKRPPSKVAVKRHLAENASGEGVIVEATSLFGNEYSGPLQEAPRKVMYVVGPNPHTSRKWYGQLRPMGEHNWRMQ